MALLNIIAKASVDIDWGNLYFKIDGVDTQGIELFPIPKAIGFEHDAVGIAINSNYDNKVDLFQRLIAVCRLLKMEKFELFELYNGEEITDNNLESIYNSLLAG
jgi:hypothetical protein